MNVKQGIKIAGENVISLLVYALIIGSIVSASVFSTLTVLNVTELTTALVGFFASIIGFIAIVGTFLGLRWLLSAIKGSGKKDNITNITA